MHKTLWALFTIAIVFQGCVGYKQGIIEAPDSAVKEGVVKAVKNINWKTAPVQKGFGIITGYGDTAKFKEADVAVYKEGTNPRNNTGTFGLVALTPLNDSTTVFDAVFETEGGDADANANLILEITKQQIALDMGLQKPFTNPTKSAGTYIALTALSPLLSADYLISGNPLISPPNKKWVYLLNGLGDLVMASSAIAGAADSKNFHKHFIPGLSVSLVWKLLVLFNITDINDYNVIAGSHFQLNKIWE